ncbi:MFS transporter [Chloroflexota bacterium]
MSFNTVNEPVLQITRAFSGFDYFQIAFFGLALSAVWGSLHGVILPKYLLSLVDGAYKNTALAAITLAGLGLAMAIQPIAGALSDRNGSRFGRRRPFILVGGLLSLLLLLLIGVAGSYATLFLIYCLLQMAANVAQGPYQAFIPDLVPENHRGKASGIKSLLEITGGILLVYLIVRPISSLDTGNGNLWLWVSLVILGGLLFLAIIITVLGIREKPAAAKPAEPLTSVILQSFRIQVTKSRNFLLFLFSRLFFIMALTTLQTFTFFFIQDTHRSGNPTAATAEILLVVGIGMLISVYPAGLLSDRIGRKPLLFAAGILGAAGILFIYFAPEFGYILVGGGIIGICSGAFMSANWALATDLIAKNEEAKYLGLTNLATAGGAALSRLIGPVIDFFNMASPGFGYQVMLLTCFLYFVVGAALVVGIQVNRLTKAE